MIFRIRIECEQKLWCLLCCDPRLLRLEDTPSNRWNNVIIFVRPRHPSTVLALDWKWRRRDATLTHGLALVRRCATDADRKVGLPIPNAHINVRPLRLLNFVQRQRSWRNAQEETRVSSSLDCKRTTPYPGARPAAPSRRPDYTTVVWCGFWDAPTVCTTLNNALNRRRGSADVIDDVCSR